MGGEGGGEAWRWGTVGRRRRERRVECEVGWGGAGVVGERRGTEQQLRRNDCKDMFQVMKAQFPSKIFDASRNDQACFPNSSHRAVPLTLCQSKRQPR